MSNITCVIPIKNGSKTIRGAVESAFKAGCDEVFAFDDASTDSTWDILHELRNEYSNFEPFTLHSSVSMGVNFGRNYLIDTAPSGLIVPLDSDDELVDIAPLLEQWAEGTWVYGNHIERTEGSDDVLVKGVAAGSLPRKNITGVTYLFHRDDWKKVGGYDPDFAYAEDYGFQCNLTHNGINPVYVDTTVYHRYLKPEGNERSMLAGQYWSFYRDMARRKYSSVFSGT